MLTYAQFLIAAAGTIGMVMFIAANWFVIARLKTNAGNPKLDLARFARHGEPSERQTRSLAEIAHDHELALFHMHRQQVRRLVDAKLALTRASVQTQAALDQKTREVAQIAHFGPTEEKWIEGPNSADPTASRDAAAIDRGRAMVAASRSGNKIVTSGPCAEMRAVCERQAAALSKTRAHLQEIENQLADLPGRSMAAWVEAQREMARGHA